MSWAPILLFAAAVFAVGAWVLKIPRRGWALLGIALLIGLAGYGWQGAPGYAGAPKPNASLLAADGAPIVEARRAIVSATKAPSRFVLVADGFTRRGQYADAAGLLRNAIREDPTDGEAWLALGNVLTEYADGMLTPASLYAFAEARKLMPDSPAPDYFLGVAMIRNGRLDEAEKLWKTALEASPADAPWRDELTVRLARLRELMAALRQRESANADSDGKQPTMTAPGQ